MGRLGAQKVNQELFPKSNVRHNSLRLSKVQKFSVVYKQQTGCGGSSSGSTTDYRSRGPELDFLYLSICVASLDRPLMEVQHF